MMVDPTLLGTGMQDLVQSPQDLQAAQMLQFLQAQPTFQVPSVEQAPQPALAQQASGHDLLSTSERPNSVYMNTDGTVSQKALQI